MEIVLIVTIVAVGAAGLYVAATFNRRTKKSTGPLIKGAVSDISGHIDETAGKLKEELQAITADLQRDREQSRLDDRKIQGRLDRADSRISNIASQLEMISRLAEQIGARQDQLAAQFGKHADGQAANGVTEAPEPGRPVDEPADMNEAQGPSRATTSLPPWRITTWEPPTRPALPDQRRPDWPPAPGVSGPGLG